MQALSKEWKAAIEAHRSNFRVNKGEIIFTEGEEVKEFILFTSGTAIELTTVCFVGLDFFSDFIKS